MEPQYVKEETRVEASARSVEKRPRVEHHFSFV